MPRIEKLSIDLVTGAHPLIGPVQVEFNGHVLPIDSQSGSTESGARYTASYSPRSMSHSVHVIGPASGSWSVAEARVTIDTGLEPYTVMLEPFVLEAGHAASLWAERPAVPFDV